MGENTAACKCVCVCVCLCYLWTKLLVRFVVGARSSFLLGVLQEKHRGSLARRDTTSAAGVRSDRSEERKRRAGSKVAWSQNALVVPGFFFPTRSLLLLKCGRLRLERLFVFHSNPLTLLLPCTDSRHARERSREVQSHKTRLTTL